MISDRFADNPDPASYADDPAVGLYAVESDRDALRSSESLFTRLARVAGAYELHTLPTLVGPDTIQLNRARCESLLEEIAFVAERLHDPLAAQVAQALTGYLTRRTWNPLWNGFVTFEGN